MENKFCVTNCRFHVRDSKKLLVQGWFTDNEMGDNKILICLDKKKLKYEVEKFTDIATAQQCLNENYKVDNRYFFWVSFPENYEEYKKLEVYNFYHGVGKKVFDIPTEKLKRKSKKIDKYIEGEKSTKKASKLEAGLFLHYRQKYKYLMNITDN